MTFLAGFIAGILVLPGLFTSALGAQALWAWLARQRDRLRTPIAPVVPGMRLEVRGGGWLYVVSIHHFDDEARVNAFDANGVELGESYVKLRPLRYAAAAQNAKGASAWRQVGVKLEP